MNFMNQLKNELDNGESNVSVTETVLWGTEQPEKRFWI